MVTLSLEELIKGFVLYCEYTIDDDINRNIKINFYINKQYRIHYGEASRSDLTLGWDQAYNAF